MMPQVFSRKMLAQFAALVGLFVPAQASAELMLYPTRIVIDDKQRSGQVQLVNRGSQPETYRIGLFNSKMSETGEIIVQDSEVSDAAFAQDMLVYTPRQVTLQPGESQTVRISVRRPPELVAGEYRSHLRFSRVADASGGTSVEHAANPEPGKVAIVLQALIGASIPVIVRQGPTRAAVSLEALSLSAKPDTQPILGAVFHRTGNRSVYGDLTATYIAPGKRPVEVGKVSGIAIYVPNALRRARIPLTPPDGVRLSGGSLVLRYTERPDMGGALLAETQIQVP
jgi:fimbrial chaperone protein